MLLIISAQTKKQSHPAKVITEINKIEDKVDCLIN